MGSDELEQLQRYERLIAGVLQRAGGLPARRTTAAVIQQADASSRGEYRGLTVYSWVMSTRMSGPFAGVSGEGPDVPQPKSDPVLQAWCRAAAKQIDASPLSTVELLASDGQRITETVWHAMALYASGEVDFARSAVFQPLLSAQQPNGTFLKPSRNDNLESLWYHELVLLHAVASYGVAISDPAARDAVFRAADYHLNETQPDHATNDPWGLFAFLWNPQSRPVADGMLHAVSTMGGSFSPVTLMLLADALYCVRRLLATNQD